MSVNARAWLWTAAIFGAFVVAAMLFGEGNPRQASRQSAPEPETYRLIFAIGNEESEIEGWLSEDECHERRDELKATADALGAYNEAAGFGSITCLPESLFED